jgi:hypothetical protein
MGTTRAVVHSDITAAPYQRKLVLPSTNSREMVATGPLAGTDLLVIALEMGRSSINSGDDTLARSPQRLRMTLTQGGV